MLQNVLFEGREDIALLRKYKPYVEKPDYWMDMTTKQLLKRRFSQIKKIFAGVDD